MVDGKFFVCPRCGRTVSNEEGGTDSPVCANCWSTITRNGRREVPVRWRWPSDGGPELPPECIGYKAPEVARRDR